MTDQPVVPAFDADMFLAQQATHRKLARHLYDLNKTALFAALRAADLSRVVVRFDGGGDSGQIEEIAAYRGEEPAELADATITIVDLEYGATEPYSRQLKIDDAVEAMAYAFLSNQHSGWENNDGAYGDFVFDVAGESVVLEFNERYVSSELYTYTF